jgi:vesicle coat complex subunit
MEKKLDGINLEELEQQKSIRKKTVLTSLKLQYLDRLNALLHSPISNVERSEVRRRAEALCDSIEDDLNISGDNTKSVGESSDEQA